MKKRYLTFGLLTCLLFLLGGCKVATVAVQSAQYRPNQEVGTDQAVNELILPYRDQLDAEMNEVLGQTEMNLDKANPESTLGNWLVDAFFVRAQLLMDKPLDFALLNYGGIRVPQIPKGPVTRGKVFEAMPFDNLAVVIEASGVIVRRLFEHIAQRNGWPVTQQVKMVIKNQTLVQLLINGQPLEEDQVYRFVLPDFIANGGDRCDFLRNERRYNLGILVRDQLVDFVKAEQAAGRKLRAAVEGRVVIVQ